MRTLFAMERRLQEMERRLENMHRMGDITDTKYDKDKKRWFVKFSDGAEDKPEGPSKEVTTDWMPWQAFSHATIKISFPPRKGMKAQLNSPNGMLEQGSVAAYGYGPETPSPAGDPDQLHIRVEKETKEGKPGDDKNQILDMTFTKDGSKVAIGDTTHTMSKDTISHETKNNNVKSDNHNVDTKTATVKAQTHTLTADNRTVNAKTTTIKSSVYSLGGKVLINC